MEIEDEIFLEDDQEILDIINFGFPRRTYERSEYFDEMDNASFYRRFRLTKGTTLNILEQIEPELEFDNNLNNNVSPINQLLTTLRFFACAGHQNSIGDFMGVHQATVSRVVEKVTNAIVGLRQTYIKIPTQHEVVPVGNDFYNIARFPRVLGCIDGTHIKIQSPGGEDAEVFRNRKSYFSINTQVICDAHLKIRDIVARWPGSVHDITIFNNSRIRAIMEQLEYENSVLLGDSGYANRSYLLVPVQNPTTRAEQLYNESHIRTRNTVERQIGVWKRRFPVLAYGLRCKLNTAFSVIVATAILHNIAVDMNEGVPPPPEDINQNQLEYLINQGNIVNIADNIRNDRQLFDNRQNLINNYFAHL